jgi:hypothetical protein
MDTPPETPSESPELPAESPDILDDVHYIL